MKQWKAKNLLDALRLARQGGFGEEFVVRRRGFLLPDRGRSWEPEEVVMHGSIAFDEPNRPSVLYLLEAPGGHRGWLGVLWGVRQHPRLEEYLERTQLVIDRKEQFGNAV